MATQVCIFSQLYIILLIGIHLISLLRRKGIFGPMCCVIPSFHCVSTFMSNKGVVLCGGHAIKKGLKSVKFSALNIQRGLKQSPTLPCCENFNPEREMPTVRDTVCVPIFDTVGQYGDVTGHVTCAGARVHHRFSL